VVIAIILSFTIHEFAHAYFADRFGDPTPRKMGRVTLHPMAQIDILGVLMFLVAGFGWAKPVVVNRNYFKKPRLMDTIVTVAGPLSNLVLAFVTTLLFMILIKTGALSNVSTGAASAIGLGVQYLITINLTMFIFNLIPLPPLDGFHIVYNFLPGRLQAEVWNRQHWGMVIFLLIVFIDPLGRLIIDPLFALTDNIFFGMINIIEFFI
jgi:Zn-dependent protease